MRGLHLSLPSPALHPNAHSDAAAQQRHEDEAEPKPDLFGAFGRCKRVFVFNEANESIIDQAIKQHITHIYVYIYTDSKHMYVLGQKVCPSLVQLYLIYKKKETPISGSLP